MLLNNYIYTRMLSVDNYMYIDDYEITFEKVFIIPAIRSLGVGESVKLQSWWNRMTALSPCVKLKVFNSLVSFSFSLIAGIFQVSSVFCLMLSVVLGNKPHTVQYSALLQSQLSVK